MPSTRTRSAAKVAPRRSSERGRERPVLARREGLDLALALDDQAHGDRLDAAGREAAAHLARDERAERVADQAVDDAARLLGVDEVDVDRARVREGLADGALGDLAEGHAALLGDRHVGGLGDVPGDGLALAVEVGGQVDGVRGPRGTRDVRDLAPARLGDDVLRREVVLDVDAELALAGVLRQVTHVAVAGQDPVVLAEVPLDRARLGR